MPVEKTKREEAVEAAVAHVNSVWEAAEKAAEIYKPDELEKHANIIMKAWEVRLQKQTDEYIKRVAAYKKQEKVTTEIAEPWSLPPFAPPYPWWNVLLAGPFQPGVTTVPHVPPGPYLPHKIIAAGEPAFMVGAVWRNPFGIDWNGTNPPASVVMSAFNMTIWLESVNMTSVVNGPDFGPINFAPMGAGFLNLFFAPITFPAPASGKPHLYEMNLIADVSGPVPGLPFAGYSTWVFNPDTEPAIFPPMLMPGVGPHMQYDIPARFLVYTP